MENVEEKKDFGIFTKKYFTEHDFVAVFLQLLCENGVRRVTEKELEQKLYYYYKNPEFKELFQNIGLSKDAITHNEIRLYEGLYKEKYFGGGNVWFEQNHSDILNLAYDKDNDLSIYEQALSEDGKLKIRQIAEEFAIRKQAEKESENIVNIYGLNPNYTYSLLCGKRGQSVVNFELITDGDISSIEYRKQTEEEKNVFYDSPIDPDTAIKLENTDLVSVTIENASYAIRQGICNEKIRYCDINTELLDLYRLKKIVSIANQIHKDNKKCVIDGITYVRKLKLDYIDLPLII